MAKMMGPRFKKCRSLGINVYGHPKAMDRFKSGDSRADKKLSNYGLQLLEKQRLRAYYGVMEKQMRNYASKAFGSGENPGEFLLKTLEVRLDNLVYRMGFAASIRQARQMVVHGHFLVNGKKVDIPSFSVSAGDQIVLREKSRKTEQFNDNFMVNPGSVYPYIEKSSETFSASLTRLPQRDEIPVQIDDHLIVEFYSRLN